MTIAITVHDTGVRFRVQVQPRARRPGIDGLHGDALRVRVSAPPVDGAANDDVITTVADALGCPRRAVRIIAGVTARTKTVEVDGVTADAIVRLVSAPHSTP